MSAQRHELPDQVIPGLHQGPKPAPGVYNAAVLVLMAEEYQPRSQHFPGAFVVHAPIDDSFSRGVAPHEEQAIHQAATIVAKTLRQGKIVMVTCNMGLNRSGVVSALAMRMVHPNMSADEAIEHVRRARGPWALSNPHFERIVRDA